MNQNDVREAIDILKRLRIATATSNIDGFRVLEPLSLAISALEKQVAKKPEPCSSGEVCPCCGRLFWMYKNLPREQLAEWCDTCGQKLDWARVENNERNNC